MKKNKILNKVLLFLCLIVFIFSASSCKSHKKSLKDSGAYTGQTIKNNRKKNKGHNIGDKIVDEALTWIGTKYEYAGMEKGKSTDCSGMVMVIYQEVAGIKLPRNSAKQAEFCTHIHEKEILPGDLVFFATGKDPKKVSHVGIMVDNISFVHASSTKGVIISTMTMPYFREKFIKYGRVPL